MAGPRFFSATVVSSVRFVLRTATNGRTAADSLTFPCSYQPVSASNVNERELLAAVLE